MSGTAITAYNTYYIKNEEDSILYIESFFDF